MICIVGTRGSGKTVRLVELSEKTGIPIVTINEQMGRHITYTARKMGAEIPKVQVRPFTAKSYGQARQPVLVDEAQMILERVLGSPVEVAVFSAHQFDFSTLSIFDLIGAWLRSRHVERLEDPRREVIFLGDEPTEPPKDIKIKDPSGKVRKIRYIPNINGFGAEAYVRVGLVKREQQFAASHDGAIRNLIDRLAGEGWEVVS